MRSSRRTVLARLPATLGAAALCACAGPRARAGRQASIGTSAIGRGYEAAARYSARHSGVSLLVMQGGKVLFEDYPGEGSVASGWELASGTKSFTGIMAAAAAADGLLALDEAAALTLTEWRGDPGLSTISIRHLLSLRSGIAGKGPAARPPGYAAATRAALSIDKPGARFRYGPEPFQIFGEILQRKLRSRGLSTDPAAWLQTRVLERIGVRPTGWRRGEDGNPLLPQGASLTARDWAAFGQWVLDGAAGVDRAVHSALFEASAANPGYGLSWWLLRPGLVGPGPRAGIDDTSIGAFAMAEDVVMAAGAGNQRLYLVRKRGLVVVRQANRIVQQMLSRSGFNDGDFLEALLA